MDELAKITDHLEYLFLIKVANGLKAGSVDVVTAKSLAQEYLKIEPFASIDDAKSKIEKLASLHPVLQTLKEFIDGYFYEHHKDSVIEEMKTHIRAGNIDEALNVVQR